MRELSTSTFSSEMSLTPLTADKKTLCPSPLNPVVPDGQALVRWTRLLGSARGLAIARAAAAHAGPLIVLTRSVEAADQLGDEIRFYASGLQDSVHLFPDGECLPYDVFSPHQGLVAQRLETLYRLPSLARG